MINRRNIFSANWVFSRVFLGCSLLNSFAETPRRIAATTIANTVLIKKLSTCSRTAFALRYSWIFPIIKRITSGLVTTAGGPFRKERIPCFLYSAKNGTPVQVFFFPWHKKQSL